LIDDEEATLKRFRRRGASIALEPANASYEVRILPPNRSRFRESWSDFIESTNVGVAVASSV
jgi:hypothetical protein